jgi:hypothetical protein
MKKLLNCFIIALVFLNNALYSQGTISDNCKLKIGTNLGGISDYGTELPFVDLMHSCRTWYTKNTPSTNFNSGYADSLLYRADGYPAYMPQTVAGTSSPQRVSTIWAVTDGWQPGTYTVLFDGKGTLSFWGLGIGAVQQINSNKITIDFPNTAGGILELTIDSSLAADPVRNIRMLMPGSELIYQSQPFNPVWLRKLLVFKTVRFMDWFQTNNWGQPDGYTWDDTTLFDWNQRAQMDHYTWANNKGIPYEMAIKLMNDYDLDGWVCVPHRASNNYITQMATLFKNTAEPQRKITVEYSNEIWNWMFGQTQWLNTYGCVNKGKSWPEGIVPYVHNCLNIWTNVFAGQMERIVRTCGVQTAWQDVSNRIVFNVAPGTIDAFSPAYYFGLSEAADNALDLLGTSATAADVVRWTRIGREQNEKLWIISQKQTIGDSLHIPMLFYEGGQHLTPTPFGVQPTYANALLDVQRDTSIYNLYTEWYDFLKTLQTGNTPLTLMNFSFISARSAQYGSWGILETMEQDTAIIKAPKYAATLKYMYPECDNNIVLPVALLSFTGTKLATANLLKWATSSEINNRCFNLQRSPDGIHFTNIAKLYSLSGNGIKNYQATDGQPYTSHNFYRLEQEDIDNNKTYSAIIDVIRTSKAEMISIYPNPVKEELIIDFTETGAAGANIQLMLAGMDGRLVKTNKTHVSQGANLIKIDVHDLPKGLYLLKYLNRVKHWEQVK